MSVSTAPIATNKNRRGLRLTTRQRRVFGVALAVSAGLHLASWLALSRSGALQRPPLATKKSDAFQTGDPAAGASERLASAEQEMEQVRDRRLAEYARMLRKQSSAPESKAAAEAAEDTLREQQQALSALEKLKAAADAVAASVPLEKALAAAARAQEQAIQEAARAPLTPAERAEAIRKLEEAAAKQAEAETAAKRAEETAKAAAGKEEDEQQKAALEAQAQKELQEAIEAQQQAIQAQRQATEFLEAQKGETPGAPKSAAPLSEDAALQQATRELQAAQEQSPGGEESGKGPEQGGGEGEQGEYAGALENEKRLDDSYRQARALELAVIRGMPVGEAMKELGETAAPERAGTGADAATRRAEMAAMAARAQRLLDQAQRAPGSEAAVFVERMEQMARQESGREQDMAGLMAASGAASENTDPLGRKRLPGDPDYLPPPPPPALPEEELRKAVPGRRLAAANAPQAAWMFLDTWYTVGPFPNPERKNINTKFSPENGVDLDAVYTGKDGKPIRWRFVQTAEPQIIPNDPQEYGIYYAYTEVWSEKERDVWVAIGSDDKSHLWVNSRPVWVSSDVLKGWRVNEGLRRVHLLKGRNRLLLRCENGWRGVGFSVVISLK